MYFVKEFFSYVLLLITPCVSFAWDSQPNTCSCTPLETQAKWCRSPCSPKNLFFSQERNISKEGVLDPTPYLLPDSHFLRPILDSIFSRSNVLETEQTFARAGFDVLRFSHSNSGIRIARHPKLQGFLIKAYIRSHYNANDFFVSQNSLIRRCMGAARIRQCIQLNHITHFAVPDKWLYELPSNNPHERTFVLIVQKMNIFGSKESKKVWRTRVTKRHLQEFYTIAKCWYSSSVVSFNVPYSKENKFCFIDTEHEHPLTQLIRITKYLNPTMSAYWRDLIQ